MSAHRRRIQHFSRASGPRRALVRGLVISLIEHGRITTTVQKAKEIRRHAEKLVTLGKDGGTATRRLLMSRYPNAKAIDSVMTDISPRFKTRPGGYTRIIKIGRRPGDTAEMAFLEFVDYDFNAKAKTAKSDKKGEKKEDKTAKKEATVARRLKMRQLAAKKKSVKQMQKQSRVEARS